MLVNWRGQGGKEINMNSATTKIIIIDAIIILILFLLKIVINAYPDKIEIDSITITANLQGNLITEKKGRYLYKTFIKIEDGGTIVAGPTFKNKHVYIVLEDDAGKTFIKKYKTGLPEKID